MCMRLWIDQGDSNSPNSVIRPGRARQAECKTWPGQAD
ncbi:hypothetical protein MANES_01G202351v8 [Manihot esculenta]|uniref:Uncharacterized protein n=1 Tax=Manihot esculenta TaxID=3983 RepID=A0ACB7IEP6_MANES|nr:hypothetical protein MANES_01G202351v8 [Manihot esculenta]